MKPCSECVEENGKPLCTHSGCCVFDEVPRLFHGSPDVKIEGVLASVDLACGLSIRQGS
jgi:hypothetical protein